MNNTTRIDHATVKFFNGLEVDGYRLPNGEFRVGSTGASTTVGFTKGWFSQVHSRSGETLKALQSMGYTGSQVSGIVERDGKRGASQVNTISLDDFALLILYAAIKGKKEAIALQLAFTKMSINDFFRDAFGDDPLTVEQKRAELYRSYAATINWLEEDRDDLRLIEEQELFLLSN